jgi:hypothetical protein
MSSSETQDASVAYSIILMEEYATETPLDFSGWLHIYDSLYYCVPCREVKIIHIFPIGC